MVNLADVLDKQLKRNAGASGLGKVRSNLSAAMSTQVMKAKADMEEEEANKTDVNKSKCLPDKDVEKESPSSGDQSDKTWKPTMRFCFTFSLICLVYLLSAFEASVTGNVMPTISSKLSLGNAYIWGHLAFLLAMTIIQPLYSQVQDPLGRKAPVLAAITIFAVGSVMCGAAHTKIVFLSGRVIQGLGSSGTDVICETIIGDLIPLRFRPKWYGIKQAVYAGGTLLGPVLGGVFTEKVSWRWVFYMNVPLCAVSGVLMAIFVRLEHPTLPGFRAKLKSILEMDFVGIILIAVSLILITTCLSESRPLRTPGSIAELVLGFVFLSAFLAWELLSPWCKIPFMPSRLWRKWRTSTIGFINIFIWAAVVYGSQLILPIHLQAVKGADPLKSGYEMLPITALLVCFSFIGGFFLAGFGARKGVYKWMQLLGFILVTVGSALLTLLNKNSSNGLLFSGMIISAIGSGFSVPAMLPTVLVELEDSDNAIATGNWAFLRSVGGVLGSLLPALCLNFQTQSAAQHITDESLKQQLLDGGLWNKASADFMSELPEEIQPLLKDTFSSGLRWTFALFAIGAGICTLITVIMKGVRLREHNNTAFGLEEAPTDNEVEKAVSSH